MVEFVALTFLISFAIRLMCRFRDRNAARIGGVIGPRRLDIEAPSRPPGYSTVETRTVIQFTSAGSAVQFSSLQRYLRKGTRRKPIEMHIFRVADCATDVEIPASTSDYARIDPAEALALLRELPDLRFVRRLQLSDEPSFLEPWARKTNARCVILGGANSKNVIVLYRPSRSFARGHHPGLTLLHEWFHLLAFRSPSAFRQFASTNRREPLPQAAGYVRPYGVRHGSAHEAWSDLGERLFGYDSVVAQEAALAAPRHALILWRRVESVLKSASGPFCSTRYAALQQRGALFSQEGEAKHYELRSSAK